MKKDMGGTKKAMPKTYLTFLLGTAALVAIPPFAGFGPRTRSSPAPSSWAAGATATRSC
ncbi:MAG: hypothetical protein R2711_09230 [Acidimicrobiales bacterium]